MEDDPNFDWTGVVSERLIREAQEAGRFDQLRGAGQPLSDEALNTPAYQRFANRLLKDAKVLPEWLELEREIKRESELLATARDRLLKAIRTTRDPATRDRLADRLRAGQRERMEAVNTMVLKYNMRVPGSVQKVFHAYSLRQEMEALSREIELVSSLIPPPSRTAAGRTL